jgi:hypothetical protein
VSDHSPQRLIRFYVMEVLTEIHLTFIFADHSNGLLKVNVFPYDTPRNRCISACGKTL